MASLFGARRRRSPEDDRSGGGRAQRRRLSPEEDAASLAEAGAAAATRSSPGWLSGLVSGAKRVISSVLLFSSPEETGSGEDEEGDGLGSDENEDVPDTYGALVPYSESKLAIEQMVMKETFTSFIKGIDTDMGSPVDVAKSYMQSLPPWQSPFLGSQKFSTSPSKYSSLLSTVTTKEDYLPNFWEKLEESRRACIGSPGVKFCCPKGIDEPVDLAKDNGNAPEKYHAASEIQPDEVAEGKNVSSTGTKDATDHSGDAKASTAEPNIGESHINSASELRPKDAGPPIQTRMNGSTKKTSVNGPLDQSKANSGLESSGNDNPSCTNSSSAVRPTSNDLTNSAAGATDVDSIENATGPEERALRRGRKRVVRGVRGRGK
nr:unnamed protein product [Digitaria exilis]